MLLPLLSRCSSNTMTMTGVDFTVTGVDFTVTGVDFTVTGVDFTVTGVDFTVTGVDFTVTGVDFTVTGVDFTVTGVDFTSASGRQQKPRQIHLIDVNYGIKKLLCFSTYFNFSIRLLLCRIHI